MPRAAECQEVWLALHFFLSFSKDEKSCNSVEQRVQAYKLWCMRYERNSAGFLKSAKVYPLTIGLQKCRQLVLKMGASLFS